MLAQPISLAAAIASFHHRMGDNWLLPEPIVAFLSAPHMV